MLPVVFHKAVCWVHSCLTFNANDLVINCRMSGDSSGISLCRRY